MFVGKYNNSIDDKSRIIVPAKFREQLDRKCIVTKGLDKCLTVYPASEWDKFVEEKLSILPESKPQARTLRRHFFSSAAECDVDKQGRMTIPQDLREYAEIEKELVTVGTNKTIEIWSKEQWAEEVGSGEVLTPSELAESMEQYGF